MVAWHTLASLVNLFFLELLLVHVWNCVTTGRQRRQKNIVLNNVPNGLVYIKVVLRLLLVVDANRNCHLINVNFDRLDVTLLLRRRRCLVLLVILFLVIDLMTAFLEQLIIGLQYQKVKQSRK